MIIPVRCMSCGKVLADKYYYYKREVAKIKAKHEMPVNELSTIDINENEVKKTIEGNMLDKLGIIKLCCRATVLTSKEFF